MNKQLLNLSINIDKKQLQIYEAIHNQATALNISFLVVGAAARDIVLHYGYGIDIQRATSDVDFGILVTNWEQHEKLKNSLLALPEWTDSKMVQRVYYKNTPVDIVPFGKIVKDGRITWPKEKTTMIISGFDEAYKSAITVKLRKKPQLLMKVASLAGLAIMKTISWKGGLDRRPKDAKDLALILKNYLNAGNYERLAEDENLDILEDNFDCVYSGTRLLGRDVWRIAKPDTLKKLMNIIEEQIADKNKSELTNYMVAGIHSGTDYDEMFILLNNFYLGIKEKM